MADDTDDIETQHELVLDEPFDLDEIEEEIEEIMDEQPERQKGDDDGVEYSDPGDFRKGYE